MDEVVRDLRVAAADEEVLLSAMVHSGQGFLALARGGLRAAEEHLGAALALAVELPDMPMAAGLGVGAAELRLRRGDPDLAAEILGASDALLGAPDAAHPDVVRLTRELDGLLGGDGRLAAYERGRRLERAAALALIRKELPSAQTRLR